MYRSSILNNNLNITARPEIVYYNQLNADYTEKCFKLKLVLLWYRLHFFHIHYCWYKQFWLKNEDTYQLINLYNSSYVTTQTWMKIKFPSIIVVCLPLFNWNQFSSSGMNHVDTLSNYVSILNKNFRPVLWSKQQQSVDPTVFNFYLSCRSVYSFSILHEMEIWIHLHK